MCYNVYTKCAAIGVAIPLLPGNRGDSRTLLDDYWPNYSTYLERDEVMSESHPSEVLFIRFTDEIDKKTTRRIASEHKNI